jgi:large subunit ribosomal protein L23
MKSILLKPAISEKAFALQEKNKYTFHVTPRANKAEIMAEIKRLFKVEPLDVHIVNIPGKLKRFGKMFGRRNDTKKAIVTIKEGQKIEEFKI